MRRAASRRAPARGFTLIEVLVALVLMAVMSVMAWRAVMALTTTRDVNESRMDSAETLQTLVRQWEWDLREAQETYVVKSMVTFDGATLRITRRRDRGMQLVSWQLREGRLTRWESGTVTTVEAMQDAWFRSQQLSANELRDLPGISGVESWQVYFFRKNAWSNAQSEGDKQTENGTPTEVAPTGVRIKVQFDGSGGKRGELNREALVGGSA